MTDENVLTAFLIVMYLIPVILCLITVITHFHYNDFINIKYGDKYRNRLKVALITDILVSFAPIINVVLSTSIIGHYYDKLKDKYDYK